MNVDELMGNLEYAVTEATKTLQLVTAAGNTKVPNVYRGYVPPKNPRNKDVNEDIPCAIVRYTGDESHDDGTDTAKVKIICIVYSEDDLQGWRDLLTLMNPIKTYFLKNRNIGDCYRLALPMKRKIPEEQGPPEWAGEFELNIEIPRVQEVNEDVERFLNGAE